MTVTRSACSESAGGNARSSTCAGDMPRLASWYLVATQPPKPQSNVTISDTVVRGLSEFGLMAFSPAGCPAKPGRTAAIVPRVSRRRLIVGLGVADIFL